MQLQYYISATITIFSSYWSTNPNVGLWITKIVKDVSLSHFNAAGFFPSPYTLINSHKVVKMFHLWNTADKRKIKL